MCEAVSVWAECAAGAHIKEKSVAPDPCRDLSSSLRDLTCSLNINFEVNPNILDMATNIGKSQLTFTVVLKDNRFKFEE